jgi:AcrR family transcriptional regulator
MSPAAARTSGVAIVRAARDLLEGGGIDAVTMGAVAAAVGIRGPSLYKRVRDRDALLALVAEATATELGEVVVAATAGDDDAAVRVVRAADAFRALAHRSPRSIALVFAGLGAHLQPAVDTAAAAAGPLVALAVELAGPELALPAARTLTAFAWGFCTMEQAGAFRLGGDVDEAWRTGVTAIARGLAGVPHDGEPGLTPRAPVGAPAP